VFLKMSSLCTKSIVRRWGALCDMLYKMGGGFDLLAKDLRIAMRVCVLMQAATLIAQVMRRGA